MTATSYSLQMTEEDFQELHPELSALLGKPFPECPDEIVGLWPVLDSNDTIIGFNDLQGTEEWICLDENLQEFEPDGIKTLSAVRAA